MRHLAAALAFLALLIPSLAEAGRDGAGVYSLPSVYDVDVGDTIQPEQIETPFEDIESTLNTARPVSVGGTGATTAAAARSNLGVQPTLRAVDTTGSSNTYALSTPEGFSSLTDGDVVLFVANHSNTGAATLNVDSLGAKDMQKAVDGTPTALASGDIDSGGHYMATYDASVGSGTWIVHSVETGTELVNDSTPQLGGQLDVNGNAVGDGTRELITFTEDGSAVNQVNIENEATGNGPIIRSAGDDTNVDLKFEAKGSGNIILDETGGAVQIARLLAHIGDTDTFLDFTADVIDFNTGGGSRIDLSNSGVRLGGANARATTILDEDDMASDSATALATQQSIKAYVDSQSGGGMVFIESQDASTSATLDFTSFDASKYDAYKFVFQNIVPASDSEAFYLRTSTDGGVSYDSGANDYAWRVDGAATDGTNMTVNNAGDSNIALSAEGVTNGDLGSAAGEDGLSGEITIHGPHLAKDTRITGQVVYTAENGLAVGLSVFASRLASEDVNAAQFRMASGDIESGTITMYGLVNQ